MSDSRRAAIRIVRAVVSFVALGAIAVACGGDGETVDGAPTSEQPDRQTIRGVVRDPPLRVGALSLPEVTTGEEGEDFSFRSEEHELLLVYFGYTLCPDVCPTTLADIKSALGELGPEADRVTVAMATVDPERDTADVLPDYLEFFVGERGRALRTEDFDRLHEVEDAFRATSELVPIEGTDEYEVVHSGTTYVVDDTGTVVVEWPFGISTEAMLADLERLFASPQLEPDGPR